jgi:acetolactate decarboxylase
MRSETDILFISAPLNALVEGIFQADTTLGEIHRHSNFALGTLRNFKIYEDQQE